MSVDLDACFQAAEAVAREAGKMIRKAFHEEKEIETKISVADLVTKTDQQVEAMIMSTLREKFPTHSFIGEESASAGVKTEWTDNPTWIIDPIDGTTNFVHSFPYTAVSIALSVNKQIVIGIVYNVMLDNMYTAKKAQGAFCNAQTKLKVTSTTDLGKALVCAEFGSNREPDILDAKLKSMRSIIEKAHGIRSMGSAALNMCNVASGCIDAYAEYGIHAWDMAAGMLIVEEAGGIVMNTNGEPLDLMERRVLCASNKDIAQQLSACLIDIPFQRD